MPRLSKAWTRLVRTGATTKPRAQPFGIVRALIAVSPAGSEPIARLCQRRRGACEVGGAARFAGGPSYAAQLFLEHVVAPTRNEMKS